MRTPQFSPALDRRRFLARMGGLALASSVFPARADAPAPATRRPNIVFFLTDDQDKLSIGAYGGKSFSPNLDRMAREGIRFDRAFVSHTVCTPSRYAFLTGRYAGRSTSEKYLGECPPGNQGHINFNMDLEADGGNVGAALAAAGYATGFVGKFHLGAEMKSAGKIEEKAKKSPTKDATDKAISDEFRKTELRLREHIKSLGFTWARHIYGENMRAPFNHHNADWTLSAALEFIDEHKEQPFFLYYATTLTHGPDKSWSISLDHPESSGAGLLESPPVVIDRKALLAQLAEKGLNPEAGHAGYAWVDAGVGVLLRRLEDLGLADDTLFVFTSDHGSRMKSSLYHEDGVCVPFIMRWPRGIHAGTVCGELAQSIDLAATFYDLAGAKLPPGYVIDGRSLRPLFQGEAPADWRDHLYFEIGCARAVCTKDWKYIAVRPTAPQVEAIRSARPDNLPRLMSYIGRTGIGTRAFESNKNFFDSDQLYNLADDPAEQRNLAADPAHAGRLAEMRALLKADLETFGRPFGEFIPGGNAAPPGQIDDALARVRTMKIQGKDVIDTDESPSPPAADGEDPTTRKAARKAARKAK